MSAAVLRAAVVGLGAIGRHHARLLSATPGVELVACCDASSARAEEHAKLRGALALTDPADLPADLDLVIVATPTIHHRAVALPLLSRGVACMVEKPMASTVADALALEAAAAEGRAVLMVGHAERFNPGLMRVRRDLEKPLFVESHRLGVFPDRSLDVDVVLDLMIHDLDLLLWITDSDLLDVEAIGVNVLTPRVDIANARLTFTSGCTANVTASRVSADVTRKMRVFREDAYVSVDFVEQSAETFRLERGRDTRQAIVRESSAPGPSGKEEPLRHEIDAFVAAVRGERPVAVSGADGRRALEAALRVLAAMEEHRQRVAALGGRRS